MTRKQALMRVREILGTYEQTEEIAEIQDKLQEVTAELPFTEWSEKTILDSIDQWILEHGRIPNTKDLARKGLPPVPVIKNRFKMNAGDFLEQYYPKPKPLCSSARYGDKTREEWVACFIAQYESIRPRSASEYNRKRPEKSPTWATVAAICGLRRWNDLLAYCELERCKRTAQRGKKRVEKSFSVQRKTDLEEAYARIDRKHMARL